MDCTVCESADTKVAFYKNEYSILNCNNCNHLFTAVTLTPEKLDFIYSDDYFFGGGEGYDDYTLQKDMLTRRGEYYAEKLSKYMKSGRMLDIGSAAGFILKGFENRGWKGTGIEPNASMVKYGKDILGVDIRKGTIGKIELKEKFNLIVAIQVIGQIDELKNSINKLTDLLEPGGHILIETWNKDSMTAKIFGQQWHEFSPPSTLNYFSKSTLKLIIEQYNFTLVGQGRPKKNINSSHAKSFIKHKILKSKIKWLASMTSLLPENMILPYPAEDLFWFLFKKTVPAGTSKARSTTIHR